VLDREQRAKGEYYYEAAAWRGKCRSERHSSAPPTRKSRSPTPCARPADVRSSFGPPPIGA